MLSMHIHEWLLLETFEALNSRESHNLIIQGDYNLIIDCQIDRNFVF